MAKNDDFQPDSTPDADDSSPEGSDAPQESPGPDDSGDQWIDLEEPSETPISGPRVERSGEEAEPIPLEDSDDVPDGRAYMAAEEAYARSLDVCSNCGASMRESNMVCFRCGWNMRTGKVETVKTGVVEVDEHGREASDKEDAAGAEAPARIAPLSEPGRGGLKFPLIMAAVSALLLLVGYLIKFDGLLPSNESNPSSIELVFRSYSKLVLWTVCGLIALSFIGWLLKCRLGDLKLAAARMLGIASVVVLAEGIGLPWRLPESILEIAVQMLIFAGLAMYFFRLSMRDAAMLMLSGIMTILALETLLWIA